MSTRLTFLGAARNVTGSCTLIETDASRVLVDCGLFQERELAAHNWDHFPLPPEQVDTILLTHAHLDHVGRAPRLVKGGFRGTIFCTPATAEIARLTLLDSAAIQEEDSRFKAKRHRREGRRGQFPEAPLYTVEDAERTIALFRTVEYGKPFQAARGVGATFLDAGHILGSAMALIDAGGRRILFSGDVGRWNAPILNNPTVVDEADYVVVESTYGDRVHKDEGTASELLAGVIRRTHGEGGTVLIPTFAVERAQEVLYRLGLLLEARQIPRIPVFLDSPMAAKVTEIFRRYEGLFDEEARTLIREGRHPCDFPGLEICRTAEESKALNHRKGPKVIMAGSGMCTGGRIKHHLAHHIYRDECAVLFVGYQARGTLGRLILEGARRVRIHGRDYPVRAHVSKINGFSAHADREELFRWLSGLRRPPRRLFVNHGESATAEAFAAWVASQTGWEATAPALSQSVDLSS